MFWTRDLSSRCRRWCGWGTASGSVPRWRTRWRCGRGGGSHITTTIHYFDRPGDVFEYGVDSLPLFLAALRSADAAELVERHAAWLAARDRTLPRRASSTRRPALSARTASSAPIATRSSIVATPTATRWSRCWPRRSRRPAGSIRRSGAISRATTVGCCMRALLGRRPFPRCDRRRDRLGRGERLAVLRRASSTDPAIVAAGARLPRRQWLLRPVSAALRDHVAGPSARSG